MNEVTVTAAPDLSAVESALVAIESHLVEAESARASERSESISVSESLSVYQSVYASEYVTYLEADNSISRDQLTVMLFGCLAVGCILGTLIYSIFSKR